jgi:inner membrane protein
MLIAGFSRRAWLPALFWIFVALELHMVLDTLVGSIMWLWPFSDKFFQLAVVPATHSNWVLSFIFHWSFAVELVIVVFAGFLFLKDKRAWPPKNR